MDCNNDYIYSDADAMYSVGKRFLDGDCLEKDLVKARDLLSRAAALGHQRAQELLMTLDKSDEGDTPDSKVWEDMVSGKVYDAAHPFTKRDALSKCSFIISISFAVYSDVFILLKYSFTGCPITTPFLSTMVFSTKILLGDGMQTLIPPFLLVHEASSKTGK